MKTGSIEDFEEFIKQKKNYVHLITISSRPGAISFIATVEWHLFPPTENKNHLFDITVIQWLDIDFLVVSFPKEHFSDVKQLATKLRMRISNGVPTLLETTKVSVFPGASIGEMYTIENDQHSPIYKNNRRLNREIMQCENEIVDALTNGAKITPEQIVDYIYGSGVKS